MGGHQSAAVRALILHQPGPLGWASHQSAVRALSLRPAARWGGQQFDGAAAVRALILHQPGRWWAAPRLRLEERPLPEPGPGQVRLAVEACGVCHTDLHVVEGELPPRDHPVVPGHQIVGRVDAVGPGVAGDGLAAGQRVGAAWLGYADGSCRYCRSGRENLCPNARFTGYDLDGGYAEYTLAAADFVHPCRKGPTRANWRPLLCAGVVGFRALRLAELGPGERLGLYGFGPRPTWCSRSRCGAAARCWSSPGATRHRRLALELGAAWPGG